MNANEKHKFLQMVACLPVAEQLEMVETLIRQLRRSSVDHEAVERDMDEMVADSGMQRVLRNEDMVKANVAG